MSRIIPIIPMSKKAAAQVCGTLTQTSKMPCKSISLPTESCHTGFKMAQLAGSICSECYADKGFYSMYAKSIKPAQFARLEGVTLAMGDAEYAAGWVSGMVALIGKDEYFRWHDSGDLQGVRHLALIVEVAKATPHCKHWLPTREYAMVKDYIQLWGDLPSNLFVRLSAMYPDVPAKVPTSLQGIKNVTTSNVHKDKPPVGEACKAPSQDGECRDCRACWSETVVSYAMH
jgi:hypothetical protein